MPSKLRVHGRAFGYQPGRMKPVHFASGYFLALTERWYRLEWLNKTAVTSHKDGLKGDYILENLLDALRSADRIGTRIDRTKLGALRQQVRAAVGNDSAVFGAFLPYSQFGNDYTLTSGRFVTNQRRMDGFAGYFVARVLDRSKDGQDFLEFSKRWISQTSDPFEKLLSPLLDPAEDSIEWLNEYDEKFGVLDEERLDEVSTVMQNQTSALTQLCRNLGDSAPRHTKIRSLILALSCWLIVYLLRVAPSVGQVGNLLIFMDFLGQPGTRCRVQSRASFARHRELIYRSYETWNLQGRFEEFREDYGFFAKAPKVPDFKFLEQHFSDLAVRVGLAQPRATQVKHKHYECQPDTLRMLVSSVVTSGEVLTLPDLAQRLKTTWGISFGGCLDDPTDLQEAGHLGLDEDDDLRRNREALVELLKTMNLAVEPSDGLVLCAIESALLP